MFGNGWVYAVDIGADPEPSTEDHDAFGVVRARTLTVLRVVDVAVTLTHAERRRLFKQWGGSEYEFSQMIRSVMRGAAV